jgi:glycosyltransferase involved in cell wall biosynthesis
VPKVSVIIPLFNARDVITATLGSVMRQTYRDVEVIVIDDGSTDGSGELVRQFRPPVRYEAQKNAGVAAARNRGIAVSSGEYIALLDHDDLWDERKLEKQVSILDQRPDVGMVTTDVAHIDRDGASMGIIGKGYNPDEAFARLFVRGYVPTPSAAMIRKAVLERVGGFDETFRSAGLDDHELWTRIAEHDEIACIPEPLTYHRNRTIQPEPVALEHRALLIPKLLKRFGQDADKRRYLLRQQALYLADQGKQLIRQGRRHEGRVRLCQGLVLSVREARSASAAWRCLIRLARTYA